MTQSKKYSQQMAQELPGHSVDCQMNKAAESVDISDKDAYKVNDMDHSKNDTK